ncbi:L-rhamnose mutarotase [Niabella ginsenosidivorans]|uniref:L-rhamnose mutarotase n=1 Tax=Niabella ginsenosidivorans TaxID=1176587 RepID=A0A1A9I2K5_9BACT|nr:L-rhamnose mutarotase [Niabella ginsenosidivorans]ANH81299.1 L-rhamnose mutarotase [Niabella ginsenosidivorans]
MQRIAFKMKLFAGFEAEYKRRHDEIWPELKQLLKQNGIVDYSIFWDQTTNDLFALMKLAPGKKMDNLALHPVMQKWWSYMRDIMETNADHSPVTVPLTELFHLG